MTPDRGTIQFEIPYALDESGNTISIQQDYIDFLDSGEYEYNISVTGQTPTYPYTGNTNFTYFGVGGSRLYEKKKYGSNVYDITGTGTTDNVNWTGYSFTYTGSSYTGSTILYYRDYEDGYTMITGNTTGFTKEEIFDAMLTRNEHFLGFVEEPRIYSDVFVDRGKQGVMERNLRLGEIDNIGELSIYGNGFFKIKKQ